MSEICAQSLKEANTDKKDALRIRLSLEEILGVWLKRLGGAKTACRINKFFWYRQVEFSVSGDEIDPGFNDSSDEFYFASHLLADCGLALAYSYKNGANRLILTLSKKFRIGALTQMLIAVGAAALCALGCKYMPDYVQKGALAVTVPFCDMIIGLLSAVSTIFVFFSICWSTIGLGSVSALGKIGKSVVTRFMIKIFIGSSIVTFVISRFYRIEGKEGFTLGSLDAIYKLILKIVPSDIITPFQSGNMLQIVFLALMLGIVMLILSEKVSVIKECISQLNDISQLFMSLMTHTLPLFIFLSIFNLFINPTGDITGLADIFIFMIPTWFIILLAFLLLTSIRYRVSPFVLANKLAKPFLIVLSTSLSTAAMPTTIEVCVKKLGISERVVNFAIPIGTVIYMQGECMKLIIFALSMAKFSGIAISTTWLVTLAITAALCSVARPPVIGSGVMVLTILYSQLGLPLETLGISVALDDIVDRLPASCNVACLQLETVNAANDIGMLDKEVLRSK